MTGFSFLKVVMVNLFADSWQLKHPADTDQHGHPNKVAS